MGKSKASLAYVKHNLNQIEIIFVLGAESKSNNIPKPRTRVRSKTVRHTKVLIRRLAGDIGNQIGRTIGFVLCSAIYLSHSSTSSYHEKPTLIYQSSLKWMGYL